MKVVLEHVINLNAAQHQQIITLTNEHDGLLNEFALKFKTKYKTIVNAPKQAR